MKKSVEIIGLPVISITEGRELGMSKSLLIDAPNGSVAAITIEDEDWYRGVKLLPYSSVIAIGEDAVTITNSENILTLEDAGDYEAMMDANIKIIGTKAITKSGTIQGKVVEIYIGDNGKIEKCEIEGRDGSLSEIVSEQISIFGKQVTVIDSDFEKKTEIIAPVETPAVAAPKTEVPKAEIKEEIVSLNDLVERKLGVKMKYIRPGFLAVDKNVFAVATELNMPIVHASSTIITKDYDQNATAESVKSAILNSAYDGAIVLCHSWSDPTAKCIEEVCSTLYGRGYRFVTVSQLFEYKGIKNIPTKRAITDACF